MENKNEISLNNLFNQALKIPGVKVDRKDFLIEKFQKRNSDFEMKNILNKGPYQAGIKKSEIDNIAKSIIQKRTLKSSGLSFAAGLPGGIAMAGTIPADLMQFFGNALILAQELAYIYGHEDLWLDEHLDTEAARNKLILYLGVMFGVGGSASLVNFISSGLAKQILKKLPQQALTKTIYYPIIKRIAGYVGIKLTKDTFAKGISKVIPVLGGAVSGSITYGTMYPMGKKFRIALAKSLTYTKEDIISEYSNLKNEFPEIIDIDFEEI